MKHTSVLENDSLKDSNIEKLMLSSLADVTNMFTNSDESWENIIEKGIKAIGSVLEIDLIECVIQSLDKRRKHMINWYNDDDSKLSALFKDESEIIDFLFRYQKENLTYYRNVDQQSSPQLKKILKHKGLQSAILLHLWSGKKKLGYVTFGLKSFERELTSSELDFIGTFGNLLSNYILNQHQAITLKRLVEKNGEQDKRLKEFAFITSHHLRAFSSNLASLTEYLLINPNEQRFIQMISNSVKKLNGSIEDINGILTHENDLITEELSKVKISSVINKIVEWHKKAIDANEIEVENILPRRLSILSQLEILENIFSHIFSNAIKYGTNTTSKRIRIDHSKNEEYLIIRIRDFGDGIDMKKYGSKLFKAGSRFSKESNSNLGMGLFLSKFQIQKIGGRIHLKSEPGKGTSVQCYLPLKTHSLS